MIFTWTRYGGYECSSRGDRRFSAFFALMPDGRAIEEHYQCDVKGYDPGGKNWRLGKGKPTLRGQSREELWQAYLGLWRTYCEANPGLLDELARKCAPAGWVLSDTFASSSINQAHALATLLNERNQ